MELFRITSCLPLLGLLFLLAGISGCASQPDSASSGVTGKWVSKKGESPEEPPTFKYRLHEAVAMQDSAKVKALLKQGAYPNIPDTGGYFPIHIAAGSGDLVSAAYLVAAGSNLNAFNKEGLTPLHLAASNRHNAMVDYLIRSGADSEIRDPNGLTAKNRLAMAHRGERPPPSPAQHNNQPPPVTGKLAEPDYVTQALLDFYAACKKFWAEQGSDQSCNVDLMVKQYDLSFSEDVVMEGSGPRPAFFGKARHGNIGPERMIDANGSVQ